MDLEPGHVGMFTGQSPVPLLRAQCLGLARKDSCMFCEVGDCSAVSQSEIQAVLVVSTVAFRNNLWERITNINRVVFS